MPIYTLTIKMLNKTHAPVYKQYKWTIMHHQQKVSSSTKRFFPSKKKKKKYKTFPNETRAIISALTWKTNKLSQNNKFIWCITFLGYHIFGGFGFANTTMSFPSDILSWALWAPSCVKVQSCISMGPS